VTARAAACLLFTILLPLPHTSLDNADVADAVRVGHSSAGELDRFHAAYRVAVDDPVIRGVEIVTPFRHIVQVTEERIRLGDATWDTARAAVVGREFEGRLDLVVQLQFSPSNTYRTVPSYSVAIHRRDAQGGRLLPIDTRSAASYLAGQPAPPGTPILAATITSTFDAARVDTSSPVLVGIFLDGREVRRVTVDLGSVR
jgi:hypothetical protein